ncbi:hypothetical protein BN2476_210091 [Paraburkholderia piptadeniae]|uniref:Transposase IS66 central domain-containing protein n=1 Tax=Paraburkholderia piptadeniae TaxID=1701573 RepID=A0A1N7RVT0_9BURK|nr:hypothetical protein BN2476_210091 [Paraburkholderia piptadeniae]
MPLYRQTTPLRRFDRDISSNPPAASVVRVGLATQPVINLMRDVLLESELICDDETTFQALREPRRKPQVRRYLWANCSCPGSCAFVDAGGLLVFTLSKYSVSQPQSFSHTTAKGFILSPCQAISADSEKA